MWIVTGLQMLTFFLDKFIYWLAGMVYQVFHALAEFNIFANNDTIINNITQRLFVIIGIVMVFIVAFNLLNYIVDPDKVKDKQQGASTLIKDVVIALVVISVLKPIFTKIYDFQSAILTDGTLANLILGGNVSAGDETVATPSGGAAMMISSVYTTFLRPSDTGNAAGKTALDCPENPDLGSYNNDQSFEDYCIAIKNSKTGQGISAFEDFYRNENYDFPPFMSTIAGIALLFFMFIFCFQLAKRVGKMAIIQLLAPVCLTLEILPNKKGTRKKWFETLIKTYLDAFVYLLIIYLVILLISLIPAAVGGLFTGTNAGPLALVATLILIFGLLMFAKEAPGMLFDLLGIKQSSIFKDTLGMVKTGGGMAAFLGGTAGSMIGGGIRNAVNTEGGFFRKAGSALGGAGSTLFRNIAGARNVHSIRDANNLRRQTNQAVATRRINRDAYATAHGGGFWNAMGGHYADFKQDAMSGLQNFIGTSKTGQNNHKMDLYNSLIDIATKAKDNKNTDNAEYGRLVQSYNASKTADFVNGYETYKEGRLAADPNAKVSEKDYFEHLKTSDPTKYANYALIRDAYKAMKDKGDSLDKTRRNGKVKTSASDLRMLIDNNPELSGLTGKFHDVEGTDLIKEFNKLVDKNGQYIGTTDADLADLDTLVNQIRIAGLNARSAEEQRTAADRFKEQQRQARHPNSDKK